MALSFHLCTVLVSPPVYFTKESFPGLPGSPFLRCQVTGLVKTLSY